METVVAVLRPGGWHFAISGLLLYNGEAIADNSMAWAHNTLQCYTLRMHVTHGSELHLLLSDLIISCFQLHSLAGKFSSISSQLVLFDGHLHSTFKK